MNRRLLLAGVLAALVGGGLAGSAAASAVTTDTTRHKVCVDHQVLLPNGICVVWDDPLNK